LVIVYRDCVAGKVCANPDCGWKPLTEFAVARSGGVPVGDGYKSRCRDCFNAQKRAERAAKPEKYRATAQKYVEGNQSHIRQIKREHRKEHPEKYDEALRRYRTTHRDEINARARERRQQDLEHYRQIGRISRERHAEQRNAYQRAYGKANRDKLVLYTNRRRARKQAATGTHTEDEWQALKTVYGFRCLCCGKREPEIQLTRDHIVPLAQGGDDTIHNIQPLCARCNSKKNKRHIDYRNR
jgi:5-methylcytosine-specific restriction endonuclease McrA